MATKTLSVKLSLNDKQFQTNLRKSTRSLQKFGNKLKNVGDTVVKNFTVPMLGIGVAAVKMASDFEEVRDRFEVVFSDISKDANKTAKDLADGFNLSDKEALELLGSTGDLLAGFGFTQVEALELSNKVQQLAADLASFNNFSEGATGASKILTKALLGERDALVSLGIKIAEEDLKSYASAQGLVFKELDRVTKAQLTFDLALKQSANAVGNVKDTSESFANQLRKLQAELKNAGAELGVELLPVAKSLVGVLTDLTKFTKQFTSEQKQGAIETAGYVSGLALFVSIAGRLVTVFSKVRKFFLASLVPAIQLFIKVLGNLTPAGRIITGLITAASFIVTHWGYVSDAFTDLKDNILGVKDAKDELEKGLNFDIQTTGGNPQDIINRMMGGAVNPVSGKPFMTPKPAVSTKTDKDSPLPSLEELGVAPIKALAVALPKIGEGFEMATVEAKGLVETLTPMQEMVNTIEDAFTQFGSSFEMTMRNAMMTSGNFLDTFIDGIKVAIKQLLVQLAVTAFINTLMGGTNVGNLLGSGGGVGNIFGDALGNVLAFASGGLVSGPTLGLIGEGPGTSISNPEVVAPLNQLKSMMGGAGGGVEVFGRISGADILISSDRARDNRKRTRGY